MVALLADAVRNQGDHKGRPYITMLRPFRLAEVISNELLWSFWVQGER